MKPLADNEGEDGEDEVKKVVDEIAHCYLVYQGWYIAVCAVVDDRNQEED